MQQLGFFDRFFFAWAAFFRVLFDGQFAARAKALSSGVVAPVDAPPAPTPPAAAPVLAPVAARNLDAALDLLSLFQEQGRLVDFLQEDVTSASDADLGVAARVVHQGCRKVLSDRLRIEPLRAEEEGAPIVVAAGFAHAEIKLTGALRGEAPFRGILRHRGWVAKDFSLPVPAAGYRSDVLAAAEVEL